MPLTTLSGKFFVGMKRANAENKKDFDRIDTNRDGKLQGNEVCDERDKECEDKRNQVFANTLSMELAGTSCYGAAFVTGATGIGAVLCGLAGFACQLGGAIYGSLADNGSEAKKETENYRKQNNISVFQK